jgi:two-component system, NarL family, response regulator DevR
MTKVMIVDDHEVVRLGLKGLLSRKQGLTVVGEAGSVQEAVEKASSLQPEVIVMDVRLPDGSGVDACRQILETQPDIKVIMLTSFPDDEVVIEAILAGAAGFVLKEIKGNSLVEAVEKVARGQSLLDPTITGNVLAYMKKKEVKKQESLEELLTTRELHVLALVAEGKTNKEIGDALFLSERTVRNHLSRAMHKLNVSNRAQAAVLYASKNQK